MISFERLSGFDSLLPFLIVNYTLANGGPKQPIQMNTYSLFSAGIARVGTTSLGMPMPGMRALTAHCWKNLYFYLSLFLSLISFAPHSLPLSNSLLSFVQPLG